MTKIVAAPDRACGACSLCCKVLKIKEFAKPAHQWCQHCRPGKGGCAIYDDRPSTCRGFVCFWLEGKMDDAWYPLKSKIVAHSVKNEDHAAPVLYFHVDVAYPQRWREEPYHSSIRHTAAVGLRLPEPHLTCVIVGENLFFVFPTRIIERTLQPLSPEQKRVVDAAFDQAMLEFQLEETSCT